MKSRRPPTLNSLLQKVTAASGDRPIAFFVTGHNGSGKSTLWYERMAEVLERPMLNADRLITSLLPPADAAGRLVPWADRLRDTDKRWQGLAQDGVASFLQLVTARRMSFAFETVFSYLEEDSEGKIVRSKIDEIEKLRKNGYYVVLFFVGLANVELSIARVAQRKRLGGHNVDSPTLRRRYPKTQRAIGAASTVADMAIMFDNSLGMDEAFRVCRVQERKSVRYDCRDPQYLVDPAHRAVASLWLQKVVGPFVG